MQRARLMAAAAEVAAVHGVDGLTLTRVTAHAHVGRNTFYEHFHDLREALGAAEAFGVQELLSALDGTFAAAHTPIEQLRGIARTWLDLLDRIPALARASLRPSIASGESALSPAGRVLCDRLNRVVSEAKRGGMLSIGPEPLRLVACSAVGEAIAKSYLDRRTSRDDAIALFVDVMVRIFR
jgi:AcrR family transcriptional regulator